MKNTVTFNPTEGLIQCGVILKERNSSPICMSKTHLKKKKKACSFPSMVWKEFSVASQSTVDQKVHTSSTCEPPRRLLSRSARPRPRGTLKVAGHACGKKPSLHHLQAQRMLTQVPQSFTEPGRHWRKGKRHPGPAQTPVPGRRRGKGGDHGGARGSSGLCFSGLLSSFGK